MRTVIKSVIGVVALAVIMLSQMAVCVGGDFAGPITILSPTNGETWVLNGEQKIVRWFYPPGTMGKNVRVSVTLLSNPPSGNPSWDIYKDAGFDTIIPSSLTAEVPWIWENFDGAPTAGAYHISVSVDMSPNASDQYKGDVLINLINAQELRLSISRAGVISWSGEVNVVYRVFSSANLRDWQEEATVEGNTFVYAQTNGQRYFRVQKIEPLPLTVTKYSGFGDQTVVAGAKDVKLGSFVATAGMEGVAVRDIVVGLDGEDPSMTRLYLRDHATGAQLGVAMTGLSDLTVFDINFILPAAGSREFDLYGDIRSDPKFIYVFPEIYVDGVTVATSRPFTGLCVLQMITIVPSGTLTVANGSMPDSAILIAGSTGNYMAQYAFSARNEGFTVDKLPLKIQTRFADTTAGVVIMYKDKSGISQQAMAAFFLKPGDDAYQVATFTGLNLYVPANESASLKVFVDLVPSPADGYSDVFGAITLLANDGFHAVSDSGAEVTSAGSVDLTGKTFYFRKSRPTFAVLDAGTDPINGALYRFAVVADAAGIIELKQLGFYSTTIGCNVTGLYLYDPATSTVLTDIPVDPRDGSFVLPIGSAETNNYSRYASVLTIDTTPRILEVRGTVTGYDQAGDSITVKFQHEFGGGVPFSTVHLLINDTFTQHIWSDRSDPQHSVDTADWSDGKLLKGMDQSQTFTHP